MSDEIPDISNTKKTSVLQLERDGVLTLGNVDTSISSFSTVLLMFSSLQKTSRAVQGYIFISQTMMAVNNAFISLISTRQE